MALWERFEPDDKPARWYSRGVKAGPWFFTAGQLGIDPETGEIPADVASQTRLVLKNLDRILKAAGLNRENVVKANCYLVNAAENFAAMNEAYAEYFADMDPPARTTVGVAQLPMPEFLVEIDFIAWAGE